MPSVNKTIIVGNLGRDPEIRYMPSGDAIANIAVATSYSLTDGSTLIVRLPRRPPGPIALQHSSASSTGHRGSVSAAVPVAMLVAVSTLETAPPSPSLFSTSRVPQAASIYLQFCHAVFGTLVKRIPL